MSSVFPKSFLIAAGLALTVSGCTTTATTKPTTATNAMTTPVASNPAPRFPSFTSPARSVAPDLAQACINSAANKYFLPTRVIKAVDSRKPGDGSTQVILKVDLRDAVCTVSSSGVVKSVIDTSPKSADQIAAEEAAAAPKTVSQNTTDNTAVKTPRKSASAGKAANGVKKRTKDTASSGSSLY